MYIKIFKNRETAKSYMLFHSIEHGRCSDFGLENENHERVALNESEAYEALDKLFRDKINRDI